MPNYRYNRTRAELEKKSCKWWPDNLVAIEASASIIPLLIRTQDKFISVLTLSHSTEPESIFDVISAAHFSANLFLKHMMVLSDFGSEPLQRVNRDFYEYFPTGKLFYSVFGKEHEYVFCSLPSIGSLTNKKMRADIDSIHNFESMNSFYKDLIMLLLWGANATEDNIASIFTKCTIGNLLGQGEALKEFIKQRYIFVSRITGGAQANGLGNAAQIYAEQYFKKKLGNTYTVQSNGHIPGITQNDRTLTTFDLVIGHNCKYIGIEISFQVTTNSTIERKAGQAKARFQSVNGKQQYIAYIIDGAGNFQRESALQTICENSHCTVAYTDKEFEVLLHFIKEKLG